jgi:hypothetical protein
VKRNITYMYTDRKKKGTSGYGRCDIEGYINIPLHIINTIILFDLSNIYYTLGEIVMQQVNGGPMGGFLTPIYAITTCAYHEYIFINNLLDKRFLCAMRYMDDVFLCISYNKYIKHDIDYALALRDKYIQTCYDKRLQLELQPPVYDPILHQHKFAFLENYIHVQGKYLYMIPNRKNWPYLTQQHSPQQHYYKLQHYTSYSNKQTKLGSIISTITRLYMNSSHPSLFVSTSIQLYAELLFLSYPHQIIIRAYTKLYNKTFMNIYQYIISILNHIHRAIQ